MVKHDILHQTDVLMPLIYMYLMKLMYVFFLQYSHDNIICGITSVAFSKSGRLLLAGKDFKTARDYKYTKVQSIDYQN